MHGEKSATNIQLYELNPKITKKLAVPAMTDWDARRKINYEYSTITNGYVITTYVYFEDEHKLNPKIAKKLSVPAMVKRLGL